mgnify:CR=1 FL=1
MTDNMKHYLYIPLLLLLLVSGSGRVLADDFDPVLPPDPHAKFKVTTTVSPAEAGYASGAGSYLAGTTVTVSTSAKSGYTFDHWELNGERYASTGTSFSHVTTAERADFVAVYAFDPNIPSDPQQNIRCRLYLEPSTAGACSFNQTSGSRWAQGTAASVRANASQGYDFKGWYEGDTFLSSNASFTYTMSSSKDVTLTAHYEFNPAIPADPQSASTDIANPEPGDVNGDGNVDVSDVSLIVRAILKKDTGTVSTVQLDANKDGNIDVADISTCIRIILKY